MQEESSWLEEQGNGPLMHPWSDQLFYGQDARGDQVMMMLHLACHLGSLGALLIQDQDGACQMTSNSLLVAAAPSPLD